MPNAACSQARGWSVRKQVSFLYVFIRNRTRKGYQTQRLFPPAGGAEAEREERPAAPVRTTTLPSPMGRRTGGFAADPQPSAQTPEGSRRALVSALRSPLWR